MDEQKTYSIVGEVKIGTDEYRELIEGKLNAEKEASEYRSKFWGEQSKTKELTERNEELQKRVDKLTEFIKASNERYQDYVAFIAKVEIDES